MQLRIYTYKITFEEIPHWYWGVHKEGKFNDGYMGSPKTHKWMWEFYTPRIQILEFFPYTEEGWEEARSVEDRLIRPDLNNPLCLNENCGGSHSLETLRKAAQSPEFVASRLRENYTPERLELRREWGRNSRTREERVEQGKKGGAKSKGKSWWTDGNQLTRAINSPGPEWTKTLPPSFDSFQSPEAAEKRRKAITGEGNGMYGKRHSLSRLKVFSEQRKGTLHWVNKEGKTCRSRECPGPEWQRGRKWREQ
jgi:hypothetical protein